MSSHHRTRNLALAGLLSFSLIGAACGDSTSETATDVTTTVAIQRSGLEPSGPACSAVPKVGLGSFNGMAADPAGTAASNKPELSTLVAAASKAKLVETLNGPGPFTIFAPTNAAFAKVPEDDLKAILRDTQQLTDILTYHVVADNLSSTDLVSKGSVETIEGQSVTVAKSGSTVTINGTPAVICADIPVANGTIHVIDTVLLPKSPAANTPSGSACNSVPASGPGSFDAMAELPAGSAAASNPALSTLVSAVTAAGLLDTLNGAGPLTVFAPTDEAFAKLPARDLQALLANPAELTKVLTYHVITGGFTGADLVNRATMSSAQGGDLTFALDGETVTINGTSSVICANIGVANGTVHLIDTVLLPS